MNMIKKKTAVRIIHLMRPYTFRFVLSLVLASAVVVSTLYLPVLTGYAIDTIVGKGNVDFTSLIQILFKMAAAIAVTAVSQWLMTAVNNSIAFRMVRDIRVEAFEHIQSLSVSYIDGHSHGDIVSRIVNDVDQFSEGLLMGFAQFFTGVLTIILTLIFMFRINMAVALAVVCITPCSMLTAAFIAKKAYHYFRSQSENRGAVTGIAEEMLEGFSSVKVFGHENAAAGEFEKADEKLRKSYLNAVFFSSLVNPSTRFINGLVYAGVGVFGAMAVIGGAITVGELACLLSYANQYTKPFNEISGVITELQNSLACASRVFDLIDEEPEKPDRSDAEVISDVKGNVSISGVSFSYTEEKQVIENFDFKALPGMRIALVGPTGCGKTTLINLLMRFYDVKKGSITIEGTDIRNATRESVRASYGMVLQETWLRHGSVRENISIGKPDATEDEILKAAAEARAHSFITRLPDGYDTIIDESTSTLSAGQKQLICIARIMIATPPMLILDEATSSIDTRTELLVQKALLSMMQGRTNFVVAHRLSTIRSSDVILVIKDGRIIESGSHEELLAKNGFYKEMYISQFS